MRNLFWVQIIVVIVCMTFASSSSYSQDTMVVVHLKSGGVFAGKLLKNEEGQSLLIQLQSKELLTISKDSIKEIRTVNVEHKSSDYVSSTFEDTPSKNAIYFECLGVGLLYSINYDRMITDNISVRVGFSSWTIAWLGSTSFTGFPIMCNYLYGNGNSKLELGLGLEYASFQWSDFFGFGTEISGSSIIGISSISYRYQPNGGGFHFRIGLMPLFRPKKDVLYFGISVGSCF